MNMIHDGSRDEIVMRIANHPFFRGMDPQDLPILREGAAEQVFEPGAIILMARRPAYHVYLIEEGKVAIETPESGSADARLQIIGPGEVLGWSWLFAPFTWHLQARALERTRTIRLDGGHLVARCECDHKLGYELMKRVSQIVIARLQAMRKRLIAEDAIKTH